MGTTSKITAKDARSFQSASNERSYGARWYVACTLPKSEKRAQHHLERQGFRSFCPMFTKKVRHARKTQIVKSPLFQNYIFVEIDISKDRWRSINGTFGVSHLIVSGDVPRAAPIGVVEALIDAVNEDRVLLSEPALTVGQQIKVTRGPFSDFVGTLQKLDNGMRAYVLLQMLGRSVSVALSPELLAAAA